MRPFVFLRLRVTLAIRLGLAAVALPFARGAEAEHAFGPLYQHFRLTLDSGRRTEALGPLYSDQTIDSTRTWVVPPLLSYTKDDSADFEEFDILYPVLTYDRFGSAYRWQILQMFSFAGGDQEEHEVHRLTIFPFFFNQTSDDPSRDYTALWPVYGKLRNRVFRDESEFLLWPLYVKTRRRPSVAVPQEEEFTGMVYRYLRVQRGEMTTYNFLYPFFHVRLGEGLRGWQFWPLYGHEAKRVTTRTNMWGEATPVPGHQKRFALWPFFLEQRRDLGTDNPEHTQALVPFYSFLRSPMRDSTSYLWPLGLTITDDRGRNYREVNAPWPLVAFARGAGKTTSRVWPFYSHAQNTNVTSDFILWPVWKHRRVLSAPLDRQRSRVLLFLWQHTSDGNTETGLARTRTDLWPLWTTRKDFDGSTRLQVLALLESYLPPSKSIERNWSPLWSVWRSERSPTTARSSQSLLWNLWRRESAPEGKKNSLLFGLFQYHSGPDGKRWRVCYLPVARTKAAPEAGAP
jgi:hypothetical protein